MYIVNRALFRSLEIGSLELDAKQAMLLAQLALSNVDTGRQAPTLPAALFESHIALDAQTVPQERVLQMLMKRMNGAYESAAVAKPSRVLREDNAQGVNGH